MSDGVYYAHCDSFRDGIADITYKKAAERGAEQFRGISLDDVFPVDELKTMYRIITGACRQGTETFVNSLGNKLKDSYSIKEAIALTKGQYNSDKFADFFGG